MLKLFEQPLLTQSRVRLAYSVAVTADLLQFLLGPLGWAGADELLDALAAVAIWCIVGFHPLLLPTFLIEFVPIVDAAPLWTVCVALVIAMRRRGQPAAQQPDEGGPVIDVKAERVD